MEFGDDLPRVFDEDFEEYLEYAEIEEEGVEVVARARKRYVRDGLHPIEYYNDVQFKRRFCFGKDSVQNYILPRIEASLVKDNNRGLPIQPLYQLLVALRFYATGSFQTVCGDLAFVSQASVSRIVARVSTQLALCMPDFIKFPHSQEDQQRNQEHFRQLSSRPPGQQGPGHPGIPGVDGAIDCTHIRLTETRGHQFREVFRNRRGWFSMNVQAVCGPHLEVLDIVSRWAGSEHDSRIFQNSALNAKYRAGELPSILLGDGEYPTLPYLMTPFRNPATAAEQRYNSAQIMGRNIVERLFGVWKRRFPCLSKGLATKLETSTTIIVACAVLHNISRVVDEELPEDENQQVYEAEPEAWADIPPGAGHAVRNNIVRNIFS